MISNLDVDYGVLDKTRKMYSKCYITSTALARNGVDVYKLRRLFEESPEYEAIRVNISGTTKYWFRREHVDKVLKNKNM